MRTTRWLTGLVRRRPLEMLVAAISIALTVGFVAALGTFVTQSHAALTVRAASSIPVDWQVQLTPQGDLATVTPKVRALPDVRAVTSVDFAHVLALQSTGPNGDRKTGAAYVVSIPPDYAQTFPGELRHLLGSTSGSMLFQQTAANLATEPGGQISVRSTSGTRPLRIDGIVDMPAEDSFFQVVGLAPGAGASAPPDNVVLVSPAVFRTVVGKTAIVHQLHVGFTHGGLPSDPQSAAIAIRGRANHFQAAVAGGALVGDNLGTALTLAGEDAQYANLLFLLLGLPGLALAAVVAGLVVALRSDRRRREIALLRLRGASIPQLGRMVAGESVAIAAVGAMLGVPLALLAVRLALPAGTPLALGWTLAAAAGGLVLALATQTGSVLRLALGGDRTSVAAEASRGERHGTPWPLKAGLDFVLLTGAAISFALTARNGYQVVLAPEGIPQTQVNYAALAGPVLAWPGLALLVWRLTSWTTGRRTGRWSRARPGTAPELETAALRRRHRVIARGAVGLAVALGLAVSTAIFTATYDTQARLDVALTVGSDVAVLPPPGSTASPQAGAALARATGATAVEPLQHRFGYVGPDLQDLYGVRATTFASVGPLQDAFVPGSTIAKTLTALQNTPDGVLLSAETLHDYQLHPGDLIRIRLQSGANHAYRPVDFHVVGQVTEWPTAPKDSFIVANADYITQHTGSDAVGAFLVSTRTPAATAAALRTQLSGPLSGSRVQDISSAGSQVTSVSGLAGSDLSGLSRIELGFGVLLALACSGLALVGGIVERRRALVLLAALGATSRQRGRFLATEARAMVTAGVLGGALIGTTISYLLVKVLTGIFDPAPAVATVPWGYLTFLVGLVGAVTVLVVSGVGRMVARAGPAELRDL
ncbi:MAG: FtsX-like permease family protein [Pedococcus sp.]